MNEPLQSLRLDKWLWAARFFKTRQPAAEAINGGKVHLNGQRTKPSKNVLVGTQLGIHKGSLEWNIEVLVIPKQRRPAAEAITFYAEDEASQQKRLKTIEDERLLRSAAPKPSSGKPSKRDRRMIHSFTNKS